MSKIVGIGETVLDIIFRNDQPTAAVPGGSTFNAMISLGRTVGRRYPDIPILMVTEVGDDHIGDIVVGFMDANGVSPDAVTRNKGTQSHISLAFLDSNNDARYEFYKDHAHASLSEATVSDLRFEKGDIVLFGSYFAINPKIRNYTYGLLKAASESGAILYYDINFRRNHLADIDETMDNIVANCRLSDFVRGSSEDFGYLYGCSDPEEIYREHIAPLCKNFICTCGSEPTHVFSPGLHETYPAEKVETVSTIGAGDNFNAGFIFGLASSGVGKESCFRMTPELWESLVRPARRFATHVCRSIYNYVAEDFIDQ